MRSGRVTALQIRGTPVNVARCCSSPLIAAQGMAPAPAELRTFRDWIVGCDNGRACEAVALLPEDADWEQWTTFSLSRGPQAEARLDLVFADLTDSPASLWADGSRLDVRFATANDGLAVVPADEDAFVSVLRQAGTLELRDAAGEVIKRVSLSGASAAMLYLDEQQRRLGSVTALVDRGPRPAAAIPAPPVLPRVTLAPAAGEGPPEIGASEIAELRGQNGCTIDEVGGPDEHEVAQIAPGTTLILLACGTGAYNLSSLPFIARREGGRLTAEIAPFDSQWGLSDLGRPTLINAFWDAGSRLLRELSKGRGIGDCGTHATYGWDGRRFRLVEQEEMGECRGSMDYIFTWRSEIVRP
ncbi:DUF1176 domain-containing protein [Sphingosinicella terrae]|uniref:DUF1176 domain-containing protein n=1 Tax=Sphingosinicella terrae TaxID=2172047 RepID=UPI000E0DD460|nr:DUF1176 domain-containing protein [Sphingosinicella terrae]